MTPLSVPQLDGSLGLQVRLAQLHIFEHFARHFAHIGLSVGEYSILLAAGENPGVQQGTLASYLMIKRSNMSKVMRALEQRGLIERRVSEDDGRAFAVHLTAEGQDLVYGVLDEMNAYHRKPMPGLNGAEQAQLIRLLKKVTRYQQSGGRKKAPLKKQTKTNAGKKND